MNTTVTIDVREDIRSGGEPFSKIMNAAAAVRAGGQFLVIAPFEPVPLFRVLEKQGFAHAARPVAAGDWEVLFTRQANAPVTEETPTRLGGSLALPNAGGRIIEVDARGLEPPQPLVRILEAAADLPEGAELQARTDRRPIHLYAQLEERGFTAETIDQPDGSFLTYVRRC